MFGKLCKYEFKSIARTLAPIYLAVIAVSVLNAFMGLGSMVNGYYDSLVNKFSFGKSLLGLIQMTATLAYFGVLVALSVLTLIVIIQRFYKGLLCDEGYLMFTLPVKPWQLIGAKSAAAFIMSLASGLTALISIFILMMGVAGPAALFAEITSPEIWNAIGRGLAMVPSWPLLLIELIVLIIVSGLGQLFHLYFSMALGHLANKHRVMMSVVAFIAISMIVNFVSGFVMITPIFRSFFDMFETMPDLQGGILLLHTVFTASLVFSAVQFAVFFFGTERILSKRLNLE